MSGSSASSSNSGSQSTCGWTHQCSRWAWAIDVVTGRTARSLGGFSFAQASKRAIAWRCIGTRWVSFDCAIMENARCGIPDVFHGMDELYCFDPAWDFKLDSSASRLN